MRVSAGLTLLLLLELTAAFFVAVPTIIGTIKVNKTIQFSPPRARTTTAPTTSTTPVPTTTPIPETAARRNNRGYRKRYVIVPRVIYVPVYIENWQHDLILASLANSQLDGFKPGAAYQVQPSMTPSRPSRPLKPIRPTKPVKPTRPTPEPPIFGVGPNQSPAISVEPYESYRPPQVISRNEVEDQLVYNVSTPTADEVGVMWQFA